MIIEWQYYLIYPEYNVIVPLYIKETLFKIYGVKLYDNRVVVLQDLS